MKEEGEVYIEWTCRGRWREEGGWRGRRKMTIRNKTSREESDSEFRQQHGVCDCRHI